MSEAEALALDLKARILDDPGLILDDAELMRALVKADRRSAGRNIVDLRGVLVERLEERLEDLEYTHREVLAAAYDNVSGTSQIHRACLALLDCADLRGFLVVLSQDVAPMLSVDLVRLGLETEGAEAGEPIEPETYGGALIALPEGGADHYMTQGRQIGPREVSLRELAKASPDIYGEHAPRIRSEAAMRLDLGPGRAGAILAFGSFERERFAADQGTDLLAFFAGVVQRCLRTWLT